MGQKRRGALLASFAVVVTLATAPVGATPSGQDREYGGGGKGPVVFSYETHARGGELTCEDCHARDGSGLFEPQRYEFTMQEHMNGQHCWACHDGNTAEKTCDSCHY